MKYLRIYLSKTIHLVVWTLALAIGYTAVLIMVDKYMAADLTGSVSLFYVKGLYFFIPLVIFEWSGKNVKRLWQFILIGIGTTYLLLIVLHSYLFVGICLHLWFVRLINRLEQVQGSLDGSHYLHLVALGILFVIAGIWESEFLQKMTLYHFILEGLLIFVEHGMKRFESYVEIRKERTNMPITRILNTGTRNLVVFAGIVLVILASVVKYQYTFVPVTFSFKPISYSDTREMEEETKKEQSME